MIADGHQLRLCFIVDERSPIARNWISYFSAQGHDVHIISTYPRSPAILPGTSFYYLPIGLNGLPRPVNRRRSKIKGENQVSGLPPNKARVLYLAYEKLRRIASWSHHSLIGSLSTITQHSRARTLINGIAPDLVHAMRIPFEGIVAMKSVERVPLLISTWGNDLTLFASQYVWIGRQTREVLRRADALHCDTRRDVDLAVKWGFDSRKPSIVLPGAGGVQAELFYPGQPSSNLCSRWNVTKSSTTIVYARRLRPGSVCAKEFFQAIASVTQKKPDVIVLCPGLNGNTEVENWLDRLGIRDKVRLLPELSRSEMGDLFRLGEITVSPSLHDGTPNSLLEAMACGCFPVAGDIEPLREWITDGVNGILCDPADPQSQAQAILRALSDASLHLRAREYNTRMIAERAEYTSVMARAEAFYREVIEQAKRG